MDKDISRKVGVKRTVHEMGNRICTIDIPNTSTVHTLQQSRGAVNWERVDGRRLAFGPHSCWYTLTQTPSAISVVLCVYIYKNVHIGW